MGQSASASSTSNQTSVSTNTITDSYNQAFTRTESLSNVGNVSLGGGSSNMAWLTPILIIGAVLVAVVLFKRKH